MEQGHGLRVIGEVLPSQPRYLTLVQRERCRMQHDVPNGRETERGVVVSQVLGETLGPHQINGRGTKAE
jgi:hypothetical protein